MKNKVIIKIEILIGLITLFSSISYAATYNVGTVAQLQEVSTRVAGGYTYNGDTINLTADINLNGSSSNLWTPIGNGTYPFDGTFLGNGHTISNLYVDRSANYNGLFGKVSSIGQIKDLTVNGTVKGNNYTGGIVGFLNGRVENCNNYCVVTLKISTAQNVGGIAGIQNNGKIRGCKNFSSITGYAYTGGICGQALGAEDMDDCSNKGSVSGTSYVGGIVGYSAGAPISYCKNISASVSGQLYVGGIIGQETGPEGILYCSNTGVITATSNYSGGIAGKGTLIENSYNTGTLNCSSYAGGIGGETTIGINRCYNQGTIVSTGSYVGGITGFCSAGQNGYIKESYN